MNQWRGHRVDWGINGGGYRVDWGINGGAWV